MKNLKQKIIDTLIFYYFRSKGYSKENAAILVAQAHLETADYKKGTGNTPYVSDVYKQNNNLFGMRHPKIRETTSQGENLKHAVFSNIFSSMKDRVLWDRYNGIRPTVSGQKYTALVLAAGFNTNPKYWKTAFDKFTNLEEDVSKSVSGALVLFAAVVVVLGVAVYRIIKLTK